MTSTRRAYLGTAGLTDVGYRFYNADETPAGLRITTGVTASLAGPGWYRADVTLPPVLAGFIRWDSPSVARVATEDITVGVGLPLLGSDSRVLISRDENVLGAVERSGLDTGIANVKTDTTAIRTQVLAQVPGGGPIAMAPAIPAGFGNYVVVAVDFRDFGVTRDGVSVKAQIIGAPPFSTDGFSFEVDGERLAVSGQAVTVGTTLYPATPGRAWFILPLSSTLRDRSGNTGLMWRFDSIGARIGNAEAIYNRRLLLTMGGSLWALLPP